MRISHEEVFQLMRCSEWLQSEDEEPDEETIQMDKAFMRLHKKLLKFYRGNNKEYYQLK